MKLFPPQLPPKWDHDRESVLDLSKEAMETYRAALNSIGNLAPESCNFESVFLCLEQSVTVFNAVVYPLELYQDVSPSKELRDASTEIQSLLRDFRVECSMRVDVFKSMSTAERHIKETGKWEQMSSEEKRLVEKMILDRTRDGLSLPKERLNELKNLKKELSQACLMFRKNQNEENGHATFTEDELKGVPLDIIAEWTKRTELGKDIYDVEFKGSNFSTVIGRAESPEVRKRAQESYESRLEKNTFVLSNIFDLRRRIAKVLGYKTWADYKTEVKMVKTGKRVEEFLFDIEKKLHPVGLKDYEALLTIKKEEYLAKGLPFDNKLYSWDKGYYQDKYMKSALDLDGSIIKEYFPVNHVVPLVLEIYQNLLGVTFEENNDVSAWESDVRTFAVWEEDAQDESGFIGYCYLDLYNRPGKYPHISVSPILLGYEMPNGSRSYPACAILAGFNKATAEKPALMRHFDVVLFFHEMGHVFHELLSRTRFSKFHGTTGALDFAEAPSQMLENWCWEPKVLEKLSSHYKTKECLSPGLIKKLIKTRHVNVGLSELLQVFFSTYDLQVHTDEFEEKDYTHLWCTLQQKITLLHHDKECPGQSAFGHLAGSGGYDVGYYGYLYSRVFAADMYATIFQANPFDPARGKLYRDKVLLPGSSRDEEDIIQDFLGRPPNSDAFIKEIFGLETD